jgi:POT family proton-dependent oligopeptide transporter
MTSATQVSTRRSFTAVFMIEMWERFGYYGMAALLVLFMVQKLGFHDSQANLVWGAFTALVYTSPAIGGWIGDKVLGTRRTMRLGAMVLMLGYFLLAAPNDTQLYMFSAMGVVVVGNGLFKANAANLVRRIYAGDDARIDSAFTWYYMAVNIGSTMSVILTPWIKDHWGWHAAFAVSGCGMLLGLLNFVLLRRALQHIGSPTDEHPVNRRALLMVLAGGLVVIGLTAVVLQHKAVAVSCVYFAAVAILCIFAYLITHSDRAERTGLIAALILMLEALLFFVFYQQMSTSLTLFALRNVNWDFSLLGFHLFTWTPAQYQALNPIWILLLSPVLATLYTRLGRNGRDASIAAKFAMGFFVVAVGFLIYAVSGYFAVNGRVSSWFLVWGYGFYSLGELLVSGLGLAMMSRYVPQRMSGFMMGAYFVMVGIAGYLGGVVANFAQIPETMTDPVLSLPLYTHLFGWLGVVALGGTLLAIALLPLMKRLSAKNAGDKQQALAAALQTGLYAVTDRASRLDPERRLGL